MGTQVGLQDSFQNSVLLSAKFRRRHNKLPAKLGSKKKKSCLKNVYLTILKAKIHSFFKDPPCKFLLLNLSKQKFSKFKFFGNYNVGGMPGRYTLSARYTLCAHCILYIKLQRFLNLRYWSTGGETQYPLDYENIFYRIFCCVFACGKP